MTRKKTIARIIKPARVDYKGLVGRIARLLDEGRRTTVRVANAILTTTYWEVGRQIVEFEQRGSEKAEYGDALLKRLGDDLSTRLGRGFSRSNLQSMRLFYLGWEICQTLSGKFAARANCQTLSGNSEFANIQRSSAQFQPVSPDRLPVILANATPELFPLPWSHYVRLMSVKDDYARWFYEDEAIVAGWSVRQLDRMISTQHYERTLLSMILKSVFELQEPSERSLLEGENGFLGTDENRPTQLARASAPRTRCKRSRLLS